MFGEHSFGCQRFLISFHQLNALRVVRGKFKWSGDYPLGLEIPRDIAHAVLYAIRNLIEMQRVVEGDPTYAEILRNRT